MIVKKPSIDDICIILYDDEIYDRVTDDNCPKKEDFNLPDISNIDVLGGYIDNKIVGLFMVHDSKLHFMVLKKHRKYARSFLQKCLKLYEKPVYCEIPVLYNCVINFAKKSGFKLIAILKDAHTKNNKKFNVYKLLYGV